MIRLLSLAAALTLLVVPAAQARSRVRCGSGVTIYQDGKLRIFGVKFVDRNDPEGPFTGYDEYACLGRSARPLGIASVGSDLGVNSSDVPEITFDGSRYLAVNQTDDSEGGPDSSYVVFDLKTRHSRFTNGVCCAENGELPGSMRIGPGGILVTDDDDLSSVRRGGVHAVPGTAASDLALVGSTVYWTDGGAARSETLPGTAPTAGEDHELEPVEVRGKPDCAPARSTTLLRTARLQVYTRRSRRFACRIGHRGSFAFSLAGARTPRDLRVAGARWVLALDTYGDHDVLQVADLRKGKVVTTVDVPAIAQATILSDGTAAWIETGGRLLSQAPGAAAPAVLAEAAAAPTALAGGRSTIYWTAGGAPQLAAG